MYHINPQIRAFHINGLTRKDEVVIHRIRIGHTRLTHSYVMEGGHIDRPPPCHYCGEDVLTIQHLLIDCTHFEFHRARYFDGARDMRDLFERFSFRYILAFLKESHLYEQI